MMENNNCENIQDDKPYVVEMINTFKIGGYWFLKRHQYPYIRSEILECEERFVDGFKYCLHHIVFHKDIGVEVAIPEHIGILTDQLKTAFQQDIIRYLEEKYKDNIIYRWEAYKKYLGIDPSDKNRAMAQRRSITPPDDIIEEKEI